MIRSREQLLEQLDVANAEIADLKDIIREALKVLHKTAVSKKTIADRMRAALGLLPGEPVRRD